ncbi:hypothetical protein [Aeromonas enteropelogenes]|uniref:hypothetical protein n=1 Tax=Aeromonas enteropelogenes TaxID=29489 RepID=UPI003BA2792F
MYPDFTEINPIWRLVDPLNVIDAACLIAGVEPTTLRRSTINGELWFESENGRKENDGANSVGAALVGLGNAIIGGLLEADEVRRAPDGSKSGNDEKPWPVDIELSMVSVHNVREWLRSKGVRDGFFFPEPVNEADYLNPEHPRYAPKLAALVQAWLAYEPIQGKSPKQALTKWLNEHASEFGLTDDDGKPYAGIAELAASANWDIKGGAPKTPSGK